MQLARDQGASAQEIVDVLRLATAQGLEGCHVGVGILAEELAMAGIDSDQAALSNEQQALRDAYVAQFGDWPEFCELWLRADPGYFAAMLDLLVVGRQAGGLDERSGCLITLALNGCFTALNSAALRLQIRRALRLGIDRREILQVLQMTAHLGVHACAIGVPLLMDSIDLTTDKSPAVGA
jgi:alkylhydroperoxidase/carboxymuconolactone decarboxylase family protein YurZ